MLTHFIFFVKCYSNVIYEGHFQNICYGIFICNSIIIIIMITLVCGPIFMIN